MSSSPRQQGGMSHSSSWSHFNRNSLSSSPASAVNNRSPLGFSPPVHSHFHRQSFGSQSRPGSRATTTSTLRQHSHNNPERAREWNLFGTEVTLRGIKGLVSPAEAETDIGANASKSTDSSHLEIASYHFAADRWKLEIVQLHSNKKFSLFVTCQMDEDYGQLDVGVPASVHIGVREPFEPNSSRSARGGWLWQELENSYIFGQDCEFYESRTFPGLETFLLNSRVAELDSITLSVQVQLTGYSAPGSPIPAPPVYVEDHHLVPHNVIWSLESLVDEASTADVRITVCEQQRPASALGISTSTEGDISLGLSTMSMRDVEPPTQIRKRTIYAHAAVLRSRSEYFMDMLREGSAWVESTKTADMLANGTPKMVHSLHIEGEDFVTVWHFVHWLYTNEIQFVESEDIDALRHDHDLTDMHHGLLRILPWTWTTRASLLPRKRKSGSISTRQDDESSVGSGGTDATAATSPLSRPVSSLSSKSTVGRSSSKAPPTPTAPARKSSIAHNTTQARPVSRTPSTASNAVPSGKTSPAQSFAPFLKSRSSRTSDAKDSRPDIDPHAHPSKCDRPASALAIYRLAHRYNIVPLMQIALQHIVAGLTPNTAFSLLLATPLWPDLHQSIKNFALENYYQVLKTPEFRRCYEEVGNGLWESGGSVLFEFTSYLVPADF